MNLQLLQSFLIVAKCKNFTQAAQYLNFTQPAISSHITTLEKLYGIALFKRDGKNVYLTNAGTAFLEDARRILEDYENSLERMSVFHRHQATLRIAVSTQCINYFLMDILYQLRQEFEDLRIEVHRCMTVDATIKETFADKIYDLAFIHLDAQPLYTKRKTLWQQKNIWVVAKALYEEKGYSENIYDYSLVGYPKTGVYFTALQEKVDFSRFRMESIYSDSESVKLATLKGLGVSLLPEVKIRKELADGSFVAIAEECGLELMISLLYRQTMEMTPVLRRFFSLLDESAEGERG